MQVMESGHCPWPVGCMGGRLVSQDDSVVKLLLVSSKDGMVWEPGGQPSKPSPSPDSGVLSVITSNQGNSL